VLTEESCRILVLVYFENMDSMGAGKYSNASLIHFSLCFVSYEDSYYIINGLFINLYCQFI